MDCHLPPNLLLQLTHLRNLGCLPHVVQVDVVLLLSWLIALRDGSKRGRSDQDIHSDDGDTNRDGSDHEIPMDVILNFIIHPSGGSDGHRGMTTIAHLVLNQAFNG